MVESVITGNLAYRLRRLGRVGWLATLLATLGCTEDGSARPPEAEPKTTTPIKHLVVIFGENISFDHYFGTYPNAENRPDEPAFTAEPATPSPNNLLTPLDPTNGFVAVVSVDLLSANPNLSAENGTDAANPVRLGPSEAKTADMGHDYTPEQRAAHGGAMDLFPKNVGSSAPPPESASLAALGRGLVMAYYDGNTVSAIWQYAQNFALNDNSWSTTFGPSTPGAINLISGQTNGVDPTNTTPDVVTPDGNGGYTLIGDPDPFGDDCSSQSQVSFQGRNIGDLLNEKNIRWGWFQGGFDRELTNADGSTGCGRLSGANQHDYVPHHEPFQYYASTANPTHARPSSVSAIGSTFADDRVSRDPANHQYDSHDFFDALSAGNFP
ncbi:MAG TPA: alkaline phosphatase family protein, partial [Polyangiaceae bacterium]|nr:alkaline phosphatase family protein [Polyangiaceae bacterium]